MHGKKTQVTWIIQRFKRFLISVFDEPVKDSTHERGNKCGTSISACNSLQKSQKISNTGKTHSIKSRDKHININSLLLQSFGHKISFLLLPSGCCCFVVVFVAPVCRETSVTQVQISKCITRKNSVLIQYNKH